MAFWHRSERRNPQIDALSGKDLWLVRHGEPDPMRGNRLSAVGEAHAGQAISRLQRHGFVAPFLIVTSPAARAVDTANYMVSDLTKQQPSHCETPLFESEAFRHLSTKPEEFDNPDVLLGRVVIEACETLHTHPCHLRAVAFVGHEPFMRVVKQSMGLRGHVGYGEVLTYDVGQLQSAQQV